MSAVNRCVELTGVDRILKIRLDIFPSPDSHLIEYGSTRVEQATSYHLLRIRAEECASSRVRTRRDVPFSAEERARHSSARAPFGSRRAWNSANYRFNMSNAARISASMNACAPRASVQGWRRNLVVGRTRSRTRVFAASPSQEGDVPAAQVNATDEMLRQRIRSDEPASHVNEVDVTLTSELLLNQSDQIKQSSTSKIRRAPRTETTQQHFGGALATLVFGAALLSERLNGVGIVQNLELHNKGFHPVLLFSIATLLCAAAWPERREWENPGLLARIQMAGARVAYLGLAAAIAAEMVTGIGVLSLMDIETGIEAFSDVEAVMIFLTMLVLTGPQSRSIK